jgi:peptidoglycan/xylan/chitin deacetylase (PgdA/CDA1 family)
VIAEHSRGANPADTSSGSKRAMGPRWPGILVYHAITRVADDPNRICVSSRRFESQMGFLKRRGLRGVSVRELLRATGTEDARGLVGLTFDDGYENFLYTALPILERYGFSATVFAVGGLLGAENTWDERPRMRLLGAEGIREAAKRGMEVGSHGMRHVRLSGLRAEELEKEVVESRHVLGEILDEAVEGFCYPYGSVDGAATQSARQAGYTYACACWTQVESSIYDFPRAPVWEIDGPLMLAAKLKVFPLYFELASAPMQKAVDKVGRMVHGRVKQVARGLTDRPFSAKSPEKRI